MNLHGDDVKRAVWRNWLKQVHGGTFAERNRADEDDVRGYIPTWMKRHDQ